MKRITPRRVALFVSVMTAVAVVIYVQHYGQENGRFFPITEPRAVVSGQKIAPPEDPYAGFSVQARQVIATDIAQQDEVGFSRMFTVQCISANQSAKKFSGYGINSDVVVVAARFKLSAAINNADGSRWIKTYDVSETIDSAQFQGLTSADTIQRVVGTLKEQIQKDNETRLVLQKASKP